MISRIYSLAMLIFSIAAFGCTDVTTPPASISTESATPAVFNSVGAPTVEFSVPDMMCPESCAVKTKEILAEQPGAKEVVVDFENKKAVVAIDEGQFNADQALAALVDHGFDHSTLRGEAAAEAQAAEAPAVQ